MESKPSLRQIILAHFMKHPKEALEHDDWVDEVSTQYEASHGSQARDPWRTVRQLYQEGLLIQVKKGVYMYDPEGK